MSSKRKFTFAISSPDEFLVCFVGRMGDEKVYESAKSYWESVPATVSGMLDGITHINSVDLSASNKFIRQFFEVSTTVVEFDWFVHRADKQARMTSCVDCAFNSKIHQSKTKQYTHPLCTKKANFTAVNIGT